MRGHTSQMVTFIAGLILSFGGGGGGDSGEGSSKVTFIGCTVKLPHKKIIVFSFLFLFVCLFVFIFPGFLLGCLYRMYCKLPI